MTKTVPLFALLLLLGAGCQSDEVSADNTTTDPSGSEVESSGESESASTDPGESETSDTSTSDTTETSGTSETGDPEPEDPNLQLSFSPVRQFDFSWTAVVGAQSYRLLEQAEPEAPYVEVGETSETALSLFHVPLTKRIEASYILRVCEDLEGLVCTDSEPLELMDSMTEAVGYFKASNTEPGDGFGWAIALSGDGSTLVVSARAEASSATGVPDDPEAQTDNSAGSAGAVYVFRRDGQGWAQEAYVKASNTDAGDVFGASVALSHDGHTLVVGAPREDSATTGTAGDSNAQADNSAINAGAVYVFTRQDEAWSQTAYIKASNTDPGDAFGYVALSADGETLAVAAPGEGSTAVGVPVEPEAQADNAAAGAGAIYVFVRTLEGWEQQAYIKSTNTTGDPGQEDAGDAYGTLTLSGDGNTLAVGAPWEDSAATGVPANPDAQTNNSAQSAGAVYIYARQDQAWSPQAYVKASNTDAEDWFGNAVALSEDGNSLAVAATKEDSGASGVPNDPDAEADNSAPSAGAVYLFNRSGESWAQVAYIKASNPDSYDNFGRRLALSADGGSLAVTAYDEESFATGIPNDPAAEADNGSYHAGALYVFDGEGSDWAQRAYVKASNTETNDYFGRAVAISADGSTIAAGTTQEEGGATGIPIDPAAQTDNSSSDAGAVYLY